MDKNQEKKSNPALNPGSSQTQKEKTNMNEAPSREDWEGGGSQPSPRPVEMGQKQHKKDLKIIKKKPFMKQSLGLLLILVGVAFSGCSGAFWGGTGAGVAATGAGYELRAREEMNRVESDYKSGKIDQKEYEIRKDQIRRGSLAY